eukprot:COSAG02_NODE_2064_length_9963_cov_5.638179_3_plen_78_part_00
MRALGSARVRSSGEATTTGVRSSGEATTTRVRGSGEGATPSYCRCCHHLCFGISVRCHHKNEMIKVVSGFRFQILGL